jgi:hypothetical protein
MTRNLMKRAATVVASLFLTAVATLFLLGSVHGSASVPARHAEAAVRPGVQTRRTPQRRRRSARKPPAPRATKSLPTGVWGGDHVRLDATAAGARLAFDCANGTITQPIKLDAHNAFDAPGRYVQEHGGPVRMDDQPDGHSARYVGRVEGQKMMLTITLTDSQQPVGTFTLVRGETPKLFRCM